VATWSSCYVQEELRLFNFLALTSQKTRRIYYDINSGSDVQENYLRLF
jgi:hypothetical protein